jgi:hypothetical protein
MVNTAAKPCGPLAVGLIAAMQSESTANSQVSFARKPFEKGLETRYFATILLFQGRVIIANCH